VDETDWFNADKGKKRIFFVNGVISMPPLLLSSAESKSFRVALEQALPIFAKHYFGKSVVEMGVNFVGVGSCNSYLPFLRFAESLNIPWLIFSDAESATVNSVKKQFSESNSSRSKSDVIVFLDNGNNIENQLIVDGFRDEIKQALIEQGNYRSEQHKVCFETIRYGYAQ
jgi:hypothetical protein